MSIWKYQDDLIKEGEIFLYLVSINVYKKGMYETYNSKYYSSKEYIKGIIPKQFYRYPKFTIEKEIELIEAPINWLSKNAQLINDSEIQNNK